MILAPSVAACAATPGHPRQHPSIVVVMSTRQVCVPFCVVIVSLTTLLPLNSIAALVVVFAASSGMT
jgi:hypothetical protein